MIAVDLLVVAENADAGCIDKIIAIHDVTVAMAQGKLRTAVADGIVANRYSGSFYRNQFILAGTLFKHIVFYDAVAGRQAEPAEAELKGFCAVAGLRQEI